MTYTVQQLATIAGVSVRTLHYYDQMGLLKPACIKTNGYRQYEEAELLRLQQIMFFRELEFPLKDILAILKNPKFDMQKALTDHRNLIEIKRKRLNGLLKTIDKTIKKINKEKNMTDTELYDGFSKEESEEYAKEAKDRWGNTEAYKQSQVRVAKMGKEGLDQAKKKSNAITSAVADCMKEGVDPKSERVQKLITEHYNWLGNFYEPNLEIYKGMAEMYMADPRFKKTYENIAAGLAQYMQDAMLAFVENSK